MGGPYAIFWGSVCHIFCRNPLILTDFYAIQTPIVWHILGAYFLQIWGVGVVRIIFKFLYTCAERGLEDSALILIATWYRQGPAMTQQFNVNHGHPDGDLMTSILAYEWYLECKKTYANRYTDWRVNATQEWKACTKVGLIHHVLVAIHESVLVLKHTFDEHRQAFPDVPKRRFGSPVYSTLLLHSVWASFFDRCLIKLPTGECVSPQFGG